MINILAVSSFLAIKNVVKNVSVHVSWHTQESVMSGIPKSGTAGSEHFQFHK